MKSKFSLVATATLLALGLGSEAALANSLQPNLGSKDKAEQVKTNGASKERVIVKFTRGKSAEVKSLAKKLGGEIKVDLAKHDAFAMEVPAAALKGLRNNPNVEFVEADVKRHLLATNLNTTEVEPWGISRVQADIVSDELAGNRTVCIIDSGYDIRHSDLDANLVSGTNDSGTGQWSTPGGSHGTHVAGTVAGITNGSGVVGVMPNGNVNLHIIKVFNESGWGYSSSLVSAVDDCVAAGANVISMSLGGGGSSRTEGNAFANYYSQGVLSIAAAGNDGNTAHSYPASYDDVVSVAAVDSGNMHANFSQRTNQVELAGPGEAVLSSVGLGDGQLAQLSVGGTDYFANGVVPHLFYNSSLSFDPAGNNGSASGALGVCTTTGTSYSCGDMTGKICLVERGENQGDSSTSTENSYPEYRGANACADAGAEGIIVYSNAARPGLQAPFMVDFNGKIQGIPTASIDRATGLELAAKAGQTASLSKVDGQDWDYYNGTSMATPHVSAVAALVWSYHTACSAAEVRNALAVTAEDLDAAGRDVKTGYGLVKAQAAIDYLAGTSCGGGSSDNAPVADFGFSCDALACSFTDASSDDNGVTGYSWNFGDGASSSAQNPSHNYAADGSYTVTLTVTDSAGQTDTSSQTVNVSSGATGGSIDLNAFGYKVKGRQRVDLSWSGANSSNVDIYRNGSAITTTNNDGAYTDAINQKGGGVYNYSICEAGTTNCSATVTVVF
ncbi:S8 family serine peptidase [Pseudoalteromonas sp. BDTF-M6]|uniref:S8 family serine peptidase n=1 Tax=Pseudoalteromonas sp. BDTF-M6 TaxID=2796132 RepID=UPI001BAF4C17|nr:S8 family serine peptidase [Pseudoalteromonas sp. BDTF-M6]MBS3796182.1 S8 family serine peptidase [Pseudoalteromonas sp. BDTF-M6]